jgi:hypothetical protein
MDKTITEIRKKYLELLNMKETKKQEIPKELHVLGMVNGGS